MTGPAAARHQEGGDESQKANPKPHTCSINGRMRGYAWRSTTNVLVPIAGPYCAAAGRPKPGHTYHR
jgi:hypothetical protein